MTDTFDYLVFIGRFQPFHHGHQFVVNEALKHASQLIMLIGSANSPRTIKNPFSFAERQSMILSAFDEATAGRIHCLPIDDTLYNDHQWLKNVQNAVESQTQGQGKIGIIGHTKDESSYYLSLFPNWGAIELPNFDNLSATPLRKLYLEQDKIDERMPASSQAFLGQFKETSDYACLKGEYQHIQDFKQSWQSAPYPPIFSTTDALVVQSGHVLLIERGGDYGRGLWALPGGFLDQDESLLECVLRELSEETGLMLNKHQLKDRQVFDAPERSLRGRTVTTVFYFELVGDSLPTVNAGDDANRAFWLPLNQLDGNMMFEDHYSIITKMLGL